MWSEQTIKSLLSRYLPGQARVIAIRTADLDGDGVLEILGIYQWEGQNYFVVLKHDSRGWGIACNFKGTGYNITYFRVANLKSENRSSVIIGWQIGAQWSKLAIYEWSDNGLENKIKKDLSFSLLDTEDLDKDGKSELALWFHDTGEAYQVQVYQWKEGKLVEIPELYPVYFQKVSTYYKHLTNKFPTYPFYWYYLADAELMVGNSGEALKAIDKGLALKPDYPAPEQWNELKDRIESLARKPNTLHPARIKSIFGVKWGYIDDRGEFAIRPTFDFAQPFQMQGMAIVGLNNKNTLINTSGQQITNKAYDYIGDFSEGRSVVSDQDGFKVINEKGKIITSKSYDFIDSYKEGRALFSINESGGHIKYGYLDLNGNEVIPAQYKSALPYKEETAVVQLDEKEFALIDTMGKPLHMYSLAYVGQKGEGLLSFKYDSDGRFGYINQNGKVMIAPTFSSVEPFQDGRAIVKASDSYSSNQCGLINKKGNYIIPPTYNAMVRLGEKRYAVGKPILEGKPHFGSKYAIVNQDGKFLTDFIYYDVLPYCKGIASVHDGKQTFFINRSGKQEKSLPIVEGTGSLAVEGNLIRATINQRDSYYDLNSELVWKQNSVIKLDENYKIYEKHYHPNKDYYVYYPQLDGMKNQVLQKRLNEQLKELSGVKNIPSDTQLDASFAGDFSIKFFKKVLLILELTAYEYPFGAAHGMPVQTEVPVNLVTGAVYQLKDLFQPDSNYITVLSELIKQQIQSNPEYSYVFPDSYKGIKEDQSFYVTDDALFLYFNPYDIAPYAAGFPTFKIPFSEIMPLIDDQGEFWRSFHD
ncbi:WG repeat-containing protein [Ammoniphilus sp. CFH 90114]|uniref:WG repeat-containing protein n=1 Tax=Ammoniphilus sp. CFH 90114 TaxID=2493665 RepID=UPI00100FA7EA|nr:WG repeat-containing protein [Ammoniphilus sp. CFH 90114]RXT06488.1 DUF3298 domain-containing protein [Ammoniphilus sp. CFH 90114]